MAEFENLYIDSELQNNSIMVLCIEERDEPNNYKLIDSRLFVFWEEISERYMIFGRRQDQGNFSGVPYAFGFESSKDVCDFIRLIFEKRNCSMTYYNFNNMYDMESGEMNPINYEFFENNMDRNYEIVAYDRVTVDYKPLRHRIKLLRGAQSIV